jgi:N-acetylneuraminic acid mutarotase
MSVMDLPSEDYFTGNGNWVVVKENQLFFCGEFGADTGVPDAYLYNFSDNSVKKLADMMTPRATHGIIYLNEEVLVLGGMNEDVLSS